MDFAFFLNDPFSSDHLPYEPELMLLGVALWITLNGSALFDIHHTIKLNNMENYQRLSKCLTFCSSSEHLGVDEEGNQYGLIEHKIDLMSSNQKDHYVLVRAPNRIIWQGAGHII